MGTVQLKIQCNYIDCDDAIVEQVNGVVNQTRDELLQLVEASGASFSIHKNISDERAGETSTDNDVEGVIHLSTDETGTLLNVLKIAQTLLEQHTRPYDASQNGAQNGLRTMDAQTLFEHDTNFLPLLITMREALEQKIGV
jgi:hypothetical protein